MEYFNKITNEIDKYKLWDNEPYCFNTYICQWKDDNINIWCIRFPGATRGHIKADDNYVIADIEFYEDTSFSEKLGCYKREVLNITSKYIGTKLEFTACE